MGAAQAYIPEPIVNLLRLIEAAISRCWTMPRAYRLTSVVLLGTFLPLLILNCVLGAPPIAGPWDMMVLLNGGWRIVNGQVPNLDFQNPVGPLVYLQTAFGMMVAPPSASSITYGVTLLAVFVIPIAWYIAARRLPWIPTACFTLFAGIYLLSPRPPGYAIRETSYAMIYNREDYVLLALLSLCVFLNGWNNKSSPVMDGAFAGVLLALLLYCKITYFAAGAVFIVVALAFVPKPIKWLLSFAGFFVLTCCAFFVFFRIGLWQYLGDILYAGRSQSPAMRLELLAQGVATHAKATCLLFLVLPLLAWTIKRGGATRFAVIRLWSICVAFVGAALFIVSGNGSQGGGADDPLYFIAALIVLEHVRRGIKQSTSQSGLEARRVYAASIVVLIPFLIGPILIRDAASYAYAAYWNLFRRQALPVTQQFHSSALRDFRIPRETTHNTAYWPARDFPGKINDGIDLVARHLRPGDRIATIAYSNPFPYALGIPPSSDGPLWWELNHSFDRKYHPLPEQFLGHVSLVMVPRLSDHTVSGASAADAMMEIYSNYLYANFREVEATDTWTLYRRIEARQGNAGGAL